MHRGISPYYDVMIMYVMRQENDHYVYHNAATIAISNGCPTSTTPENARLTKKVTQKMCESTGRLILARVGHV